MVMFLISERMDGVGTVWPNVWHQQTHSSSSGMRTNGRSACMR